MSLEEVHVGVIPVARRLVLALGVDYVMLLFGLEVVVRREVGVRRTDGVLQSHGRRYGAGYERGEVLRVEIRQEFVHLIVAHRELFLHVTGYVCRPGAYAEVVGEVAHELYARRDSVQTVVAEGSSGNGERASLRAAGHEDVFLLHLALGAVKLV